MLCPVNTAPQLFPDSTTAVSVEAHADFFKGLVRDESLREELTARPLETLAAYGIYVDSRQVPSQVTLPGEKQLAQTFAYIAGPMFGYFFL